MNTKKFTYPDAMGNSWGIVSAEQQWANVYALKYNKPEKRIESAIWLDLFTQAKDAALSFGADTLVSRVRKEYDAAVFGEVLSTIGLHKKSERIEYQREVSLLPTDEGSPLKWKTAKELNWGSFEIAEFVSKVVEGALDVDPNEKVEDFIQDFLNHSELTSGLDCIAIGYIDENPCALTVVQINKESGWSRISYMGLTPEYRGKNLGKWVHRHGFTMMKEQGGQLYHGGTMANNLSMRKLFESHGCQFFCAMEEWQLDLKVEV